MIIVTILNHYNQRNTRLHIYGEIIMVLQYQLIWHYWSFGGLIFFLFEVLQQ